MKQLIIKLSTERQFNLVRCPGELKMSMQTYILHIILEALHTPVTQKERQFLLTWLLKILD